MGHLLKCCYFGPAAPIIKQVRNSSSWLQKSSWRSYLNFANRSAWNPSPWIQARQKNIEKGRIENSFEQVIRPCPQIQLTLILVCGSLSLSYFLFLLCSNSWQSSLFWTSIWISQEKKQVYLINSSWFSPHQKKIRTKYRCNHYKSLFSSGLYEGQGHRGRRKLQ